MQNSLGGLSCHQTQTIDRIAHKAIDWPEFGQEVEMGILDYLFGRTPRISDPAPDIKITVTLHGVQTWTETLETEATLAEETPISARHHRFHADPAETIVATDPVFCRIKYSDAVGAISHRRITIRRIQRRGEHTYVAGYCHERGAARSFRLDRIEYFYTDDGEAFTPQAFLLDFLGYSIGATVEPTTPVAFFEHIRPALTLLVAASRVDRHVHIEETDAILTFAEREASHLKRAGKITQLPGIADFEGLKPKLAAMRPTQPDLVDAMAEVLDWDGEAFARLGGALCRVIYADGIIADEEVRFAQQMRTLKKQDRRASIQDIRRWGLVSEADMVTARW